MSLSSLRKKIKIELTEDEALVFFHWLHRVNLDDKIDFQHEAERQVLYNLETDFEKKMTEPFQEDYFDILENARERVFPAL